MHDSRIVAIDGAKELRDLYRELLEGEGYHLDTYGYGAADIGEIIRVHPDLVILDYVPGNEKPSQQLIQALRTAPETQAMPVIICTTASGEVSEVAGAVSDGHMRLIHKPFDVDDLLCAVESALAPL